MRLTQVKLAGFKSFVDPTSIDVPGQLVGVVGPNGCGKSNIIDAVRWVLGESKASALRGESMQDVIFNGAALRKPVARASVELVFDNTLGKAAGQWAQYAEISVKRLLTRDGESTYLINNTHVRRRDIQDIFLGTGVGPRAYAIIEQGMISRVIEAKPEELRVFLEEAAGVSKYKERRRETEHRLDDTRENLARVDDIRSELTTQIEKLARQAEVAREYQRLAADATLKQQLLWLLKKQDAEADTAKVQREIERTTNELDAETARLREIEKNLEVLRQDHYGSGDAVNAAQGELYTVNAEVARLEAEVRYIGETRQRLEAQTAQMALQLEHWQRQAVELEDALKMWQSRAAAAGERVAAGQQQHALEQAQLPGLEQAYRESQARLAEVRDARTRAEQALRLEQNNLAHADRVLEQLAMREERLRTERAALVEPDAMHLQDLEARSQDSDRALAALSQRARSLQEGLGLLEAARAAMLTRLQEAQTEASQLQGRLDTLKRIQERVEENEQLHEWLAKHGLAALPRLWQKMTVEQGWENAVESMLRERLHALQLDEPALLARLLDDPPSAKISVFVAAAAPEAALAPPGFKPLASVVRQADAAAQALLADWLAGCYAAEDTPTDDERAALPPGAVLVNRAGHQFTRYGVSFHGPDSGDAGILARQSEIDVLAVELQTFDARLEQAREVHAAAERELAAQRGELAALQEQEANATQQRHELELQRLRLAESAERVHLRGAQIDVELGEIAGQQALEQSQRAAAVEALAREEAEVAAREAVLRSLEVAHERAANALEEQRQALENASRAVQEAEFSVRESTSKIKDIELSINNIHEESRDLLQRLEQGRLERASLEDESLKESLRMVLEQRIERERLLADFRNLHEDLGQRLRATEEERLVSEQRERPLRERIGELRLKHQAASLSCEQFAQQLRDSGADEIALTSGLEKGMRPNALAAEITRLQQAMAELGAINMAALEELAAATERKDFLDAQYADLAEALQTLENAIRRIDRETRDMLQQTFDEANRHFGELFPTLFGGGEARLVMTGDEILNAGVEVRAQPPGKRNSSIHLLSGGEKALTATALIFSLFQLNPAPFCLLDEVDAPLDDTNTERFCNLVRKMSSETQFLFISHNKITMEMAEQLIGVTMQEQGVSRVVAVDIEEALRLKEAQAA